MKVNSFVIYPSILYLKLTQVSTVLTIIDGVLFVAFPMALAAVDLLVLHFLYNFYRRNLFKGVYR